MMMMVSRKVRKPNTSSLDYLFVRRAFNLKVNNNEIAADHVD